MNWGTEEYSLFQSDTVPIIMTAAKTSSISGSGFCMARSSPSALKSNVLSRHLMSETWARALNIARSWASLNLGNAYTKKHSKIPFKKGKSLKGPHGQYQVTQDIYVTNVVKKTYFNTEACI